MKEYPKMNSNFKRFDENTRVKFPAIIHYLRLGYNYQSLKDAQIDFNTKIFVNRFKTAIEKINNIELTNEDVFSLIDEIHSLMKFNDLGKELYKRLTSTEYAIKLIDFDDITNNDFAVVGELPFSIKENTEEGSFRQI